MNAKKETVLRLARERSARLESIKAKYKNPNEIQESIKDMAGKIADEIIKAKTHDDRGINAVS